MGFDAARAVEPLDYDFRPHVEAHGTIPEPSEDALRGFQAAFAKRAADLGLTPEMADDPRQLTAVLADAGEEKLKQLSDTVVDALAGLCQGDPSRDQIASLPPRLRNAFLGWLTGLLFGTAGNPTTPPSSAATSGSPALVNGAAAAG